MKYIVTRNDNGCEEIFTFPNSVNHDCFAEGVERLRNKSHGDWRRINRTVISAGFINRDGQCMGESLTLRLRSRPEEDTQLYKQQF